MLHRGPVVITTLEEDFRKIGLLKDETDSEKMDEARRIAKRIAAGTRKLVRTKRTTASERMKARRAYRKSKAKIKLARRKKMRKASVRRRMKWLAMKRRQREGSETIANLIEDVQNIIGTLDFNSADAVKSFANIAIISDMLSSTFTEWLKDLHESAEDGDEAALDTLESYAESLADLAEAAAEVATALKNGQAPEGGIEELESVFKEYMTDMLEGMDLYNDLVEPPNTMHGAKGKTVASEEDEDEEEYEDDEEEEGEEGDDYEDEEGDEEEGDEEVESKRPSKR